MGDAEKTPIQVELLRIEKRRVRGGVRIRIFHSLWIKLIAN